MTINNKSERNYRGKCLGWPVTSYGAGNVFGSFVALLRGKVSQIVQNVSNLQIFVAALRKEGLGAYLFFSFVFSHSVLSVHLAIRINILVL